NSYTFGNAAGTAVIRDFSGGTVSVTKNGTGTQTFVGTGMTYTGGTTINAGMLRYDLTSRSNNTGLNLGANTTNVNGSLELYNNAAPSLAACALLSTGTTFTGSGTINKTGQGDVDIWTPGGVGASIKNFSGQV